MMERTVIRTDLPAEEIRRRAERIIKENGARSLRPPVEFRGDGIVLVRSIFLPRSGVWLANELLKELGQ